MKPQFNIFKDIDKPVLFLYLLMVSIGWLNIFAVEYTDAHRHIFDLNTSYGKQLLWIATALVMGAALLMIDVRFFTSFVWVIYALFLVILIGVLLFGVEINATRAWFRVGGFAFQPSEVTKYATALALASYMAGIRTKSPDMKVRLKAAAIVMLPAVLVLLQKDVGTTLVFSAFILVLYREGVIGGLVLFFGALAIALFVLTLMINEFIIIGALGLLTMIIAYVLRNKVREVIQLFGIFLILSLYVYSVDYTYDNLFEPHHKARIEVLLHGGVDLQGAGYNLNQSKIAIGSGGFWGKGFLNGTQTKFNFVPEQTTDFIFCTIGEEWGFVGSSITIGLFIALIFRLLILAERQKSVFSRVFGYSIVSIIFFHFLINIGMTIGLVPVIGIPLPMISYGGSSLWGVTLMIFTFLKLDAKRLDMI